MPHLTEAFDRVAGAHRSRVALIEDSRQWTFAELSDEVDRITALLREQVPGNNVGVLLLNSQKYIATMLAIWKAGKTAVPLNYLLPPAELGFIIKDSGMKVQASINDDLVRVTAKKIDDLQSVIQLCKTSNLLIPLQYVNMRD